MAYRIRYPHIRPGAMETGTIAWILHRVTGVFLTLYLITHIIVIGQSVRGKEAFDAALNFVQSPLFVFLDAGLAGVVAFHGLNGLRIIAFDMGVGIRWQKPLFWASLILSVLIFVAGVWVARNLIFV
ncbi:MAG TPA: succinate dehydrogenase, cytochrome b556 subunit [Dehalococcoidia bacterium]